MSNNQQKVYFFLSLVARSLVSYFEIAKQSLSHHHMLLALWVGPKDGPLWLEEGILLAVTNIKSCRGIIAMMVLGVCIILLNLTNIKYNAHRISNVIAIQF